MKVSSNTGKILGSLEKEIMDVLWEKDEQSIREVFEVLKVNRKIAYTTVMTIMKRLVEKGVLEKRVENGTHLYKPAVDKKNFIAKATHAIFEHTISTLGDEVVAYFINEIQNIDPEKHKRLLEVLDGN